MDDDETPELVLSKALLEPGEGDTAGAEYTVALSHVPTEEVTISISGQANTDLTLDKTKLTFTTSNWNTAQTVTVTAAHDADAADDNARLVHIGSGGEYSEVSKDVKVTVKEDDTAAINLSSTKLTVPEGTAAGATYEITLSHRPTQNVNVKVTGFTNTDLTVDVTSLHFTPADWDTAQTVKVTAAADADAVDEQATLTHTAKGGEYEDAAKDLPVTIDDDEEAGIVLSKASLGPPEGSSSGESYTVRLSSQPTATTTVTITGHSGTDLTLSGPTGDELTFTRLQLERGPDGHGEGRPGRRRLRRHGHADPHRNRRRLPGGWSRT